MANKTIPYYEQNYPATQYEYNMRGYRNERPCPDDTRRIKMQYNEGGTPSANYSYYDKVQGDQFPTCRGEQWSYQTYSVQKPKCSMQGTTKKSSQPAVNTPRYYRNMAHRRPSALCLPVLAQPEPTVRRKTKSQSRFDGTENQEQKSTRYRPKQPRHPLLPPPPTMPHSTMPGTDQTDFDTSSGDGRRSLRSHSHSSGSLSVDISRQMESLNESFNAVAKERKGKKIIYGDVEPVYSQFDPSHGKPRKLHRRYSKKPKPVNEQTQNWGMQLWDLPEEHQIGEDCWSDKVEPEWINEDQRFNSIPNMIDNSQKKVHATRNHQRHTHTRNHLTAGPRAPSTHHLNANRSTARPQGGLKDSQEPQTAQVKQSSEEKDKVGYFENLFSEVFAQGCVDNMSKKTRLDFIKDAYDKYSASYEASGKQSENAPNTDNFPTNEVQENNWTTNEYECHDNNQLNRFLPAYKNPPPVNESVTESKSKGNVPSINTPDDLNKVYQSIRINKTGNISNSVTEQNVTNFLLNVKPRRRSIKINETESGLPDKVVPRYPNLIEHMSSRFAGTTISGSKIQLTSSTKADNSQNSNNSPFTSNNPNAGAPNKDYKGPGVNSQTVINDRRTLSNLQSPTAAVQNQKSVGPTYHNKEIRSHVPGSSMTNQNSLHELNASSNCSYQEQDDNVQYSDQNNPDYQDLDTRYKGHSNFANYARAEDKGRINDNAVVYNNQEDYSSNMESNYLTIKKCQEILNQVRENFGEDLKENPEVFEVGGQYDDIGISESIERITYPTSNPPGLESSNVYNDNKPERHLLSIGMDSPYAQSENEMRCSPYDYYEKIHCQERIASINSRLNNSKSDEYNTNTIDEQAQIQTFQKDFYQQDESNNPQTFNEFDSSLNHCTASNEGPKNKSENMSPDQQSSNYSAVNQDKVKQFIHSLTGFDVKHQDTNTRHRGNAEYESNCSKIQSEQGNTLASYSPVNSPNMSATDNYFRADNHSQSHYHQQFQQHQQQQYQQQQQPKSTGPETANVDKRRLYSLPQRQEIERMQQDSMNGHSVSQTRDQQSQISYGDFLNEVPNRAPSTSQEYKSLVSDPSNVKKLCDAYNNVNFDDENENINQGDITDERYCVNFPDDSHNVTYPYGQNFSKFNKEELENMNHDKHVYYTGVTSTPSLMDASQKNNNSSDKGEFNYSLEQNYSDQRESCNQELCCYNVSESNQQYHPNSNSSTCENSENNDADDNNNNYTPSLHCLVNNEVDSTGYDNEEQNFEAEYSQNNANENAILKRKYYYMPSDENEANIMANVNNDNQSCYKSYIENLIDNSLQNSEGDQARPVQGASQGSILQGQNDVVELETDKAIDLVMNESSHQMDSKLCLEITQRLTDTLVQSHKDIPTPCLVALEEPVYLQQLKKLRWDHLRHIEREVKRLESLERFLDTCGCGHMMYTKNAC